jgi:cytochrome c-type biogenesis protein CcmH/NrfG
LTQIQQHHPDFSTDWHYGEAFAAGQTASAGAVVQLQKIVTDNHYAAIVRASALRLLRRYPGVFNDEIANSTLHDADPLIRVEAVASFAEFPIEERQRWLMPLLRDPVRAVRIEAARLLASSPPQSADGLSAALAELEASYTANFDRPEARVGLADLRVAQSRYGDAETIFRETLRLWPDSLEAMVNLAELYRLQKRESEAEALLRKALAKYPDNAVALQSLAFSLIRQQRKSEAMSLLENASQKNHDVEITYLFGLALLDDGQSKRGIHVLEDALARAPGDRDVLIALAAQAEANGSIDAAKRYWQRLAAINPSDPALPIVSSNAK